MNFTPQQLAGGVRYGSKTRVGNWLEDVCLEETKFADFKRARAKGTLTMGVFNTKIATCNQPVPHSFSSDGTLRFGDSIVLANKQTGGSLACDPFEAAGFEAGEYVASVTPSCASVARNTFVLVKYDKKDPSDVLTWGTPFRLMCNQSLRVDARNNMLQPDLYLASSLKNERKASPLSNSQLVYMTAADTYATVWVAMKPAANKNAGADRLLSCGEAVPAGADLVLQHCATRQLLSSDSRHRTTTDFGPEFEVAASTAVKMGKISVLGSEFSGNRIAQTIVKPELDQNIWSFVTSADPKKAEDARDLPQALTPAGLLSQVLSAIKKKGPYAVRNLRRQLKQLDSVGDFKMDREDLKWGLRDMGVNLDDDQFKLMFKGFDKKGDGIVNLEDFINALRGEIAPQRLNNVLDAWDTLDQDGAGMISCDDVLRIYNVEEDLQVRAGRSVEAAAKNVIDMFDKNRDGMVTKREFIEFYADLSGEMVYDDDFEYYVRSSWRL